MRQLHGFLHGGLERRFPVSRQACSSSWQSKRYRMAFSFFDRWKMDAQVRTSVRHIPATQSALKLMWTQEDLPRAKIERLIAGEGERLRAIRLRALQESPDAFATTWEQAAVQPPESWERQLQQLATFVATVDDSDVGLARGARHDRVNDAAYLLSVWVAPDVRRQGIASDLIDAVGDWARNEGLSRLLLDVAEKNAPALALYLQKGFVPNGDFTTLPPPREYIREMQLEMRL
jgi:GNAT superfamily N-acetyltransferase